MSKCSCSGSLVELSGGTGNIKMPRVLCVPDWSIKRKLYLLLFELIFILQIQPMPQVKTDVWLDTHLLLRYLWLTGKRIEIITWVMPACAPGWAIPGWAGPTPGPEPGNCPWDRYWFWSWLTLGCPILGPTIPIYKVQKSMGKVHTDVDAMFSEKPLSL